MQLTDSISTKTRHSQTRLQALRQTVRLLVLFAVKKFGGVSIVYIMISPSNAITCVFTGGRARGGAWRGGAGLTPLRVRREILRVRPGNVRRAGQFMAGYEHETVRLEGNSRTDISYNVYRSFFNLTLANSLGLHLACSAKGTTSCLPEQTGSVLTKDTYIIRHAPRTRLL